ncbi:MAG TPA: methionine--tRNA ligase [Candidatus Nanoarchaeia archaeon]|nr:methionine--tRNA ligase [Candidatus Nanoarchaeia archaeon]
MTQKTYYITTAIDYVNGEPHIGHAYQKIIADALSRWHRLQGKEVFFLTGTDEHGKKIADTAKKANKGPKEFVDSIVPKFKEAWKALNINYDRFIRTTDEDHKKTVQEFIKKVQKGGDIYLGKYEGLYCVGCEAYYTEKDAQNNECPIHKKPLETIKEESYFFRLSKYKKFLLDHYKKNPRFILPAERRNEIINRIKEELQDLSISRTSFKWGIPFPGNPKHVTYVWFDALINYYTATQTKGKEKFWPADLHVLGKDNAWFHTVYWPAMLKSAGIKLPKTIFNHGFLTVEGQKISKSLGNTISPIKIVSKYGSDSMRYYVMRATPFGEDGDFSEAELIKRHNTELADKLGNLISRVTTLAEAIGLQKTPLKSLKTDKLIKKMQESLENYQTDKALNELFAFIDQCNTFVQQTKPWETKDKKILYELTNALKDIAILISPFLPETAEKIAKTLNVELSWKQLSLPLKIEKVKKSEILFKKIEMKQAEQKTQTVQIPKASQTISYEEFSKMQLKVGKILKVEDHPNAEKLLVLSVDLGEPTPRTIVAGLKKHYKKESLLNKKAIFVANLQPATLRGIESQGMILAAVSEDESQIIFLTPEKDIKEGSNIR